MLKKILKTIFVFLTFVILVTVVVSAGCSAGSGQATTPSNGPSATSNQTASGQARGPRNPDFMKNVLAKVADKLGVSADSVTQAYQAAQAVVTPPTPPQQSGQGNTPPPPGQGPGRPSGSDNRTAYNAAIYDKMSGPSTSRRAKSQPPSSLP